VGLEAAILGAPAMQGLLADAELLADLGDAQALPQVGLGLAQLNDDLFRRMSLHQSSPSPPRGVRDSHSTWTGFWGADHQEFGQSEFRGRLPSGRSSRPLKV